MAARQGGSELNNFLQHLQNEFHITYSQAKYFLSLEIENLDDGSFAINQENYMTKYLKSLKLQIVMVFVLQLNLAVSSLKMR